MTLYTAWPSMTFWLDRLELTDWTLRFSAVTECPGLTHVIPAGWFDESRVNLDRIAEVGEALERAGRKIKLEAYGYDFMPVLHGFRLGNGDLFYSILQWQEDGKIGRDKYSYEFVPCEDQSPSASAIRDTFSSWFNRSAAKRWSSSSKRTLPATDG